MRRDCSRAIQVIAGCVRRRSLGYTQGSREGEARDAASHSLSRELASPLSLSHLSFPDLTLRESVASPVISSLM